MEHEALLGLVDETRTRLAAFGRDGSLAAYLRSDLAEDAPEALREVARFRESSHRLADAVVRLVRAGDAIGDQVTQAAERMVAIEASRNDMFSRDARYALDPPLEQARVNLTVLSSDREVAFLTAAEGLTALAQPGSNAFGMVPTPPPSPNGAAHEPTAESTDDIVRQAVAVEQARGKSRDPYGVSDAELAAEIGVA